MDRKAMAQRVYRESGRGGDVPLTSSGAPSDVARIFLNVDEAYRQIQLLPHNWAWMRVRRTGDITLAGGHRYTPTALGHADVATFRRPGPGDRSDLYTVRAYDPDVSPTAPWRLSWIELDRLLSLIEDGPAAGPPVYWSTNGRELFVAPVPDKTYKVLFDGSLKIEVLATDDSTPSMPADHHMAIVWKAVDLTGGLDGAGDVTVRARDNYDTSFAALLADQGEKITFGWGNL